MDLDRLKVFSGNANRALTEEICACMGVPVAEASVTHLQRRGRSTSQILENVRGADVFVVQPTCQPVDTNLVELLLLIDALKRASAQRITAVIPYYGYARQDRKDKPRVPISAKLVADLLTTAGASRTLTMDLHAPQIQGFFNCPVDHLFASPVLVNYFQSLELPDLSVVAPDAGGVERSRFFAKRMSSPLAIMDKRREDVNVTEVMHVIGDVRDRTALIVDDIVDTAGTLVKTAEALLDNGARRVFASATHPVLSRAGRGAHLQVAHRTAGGHQFDSAAPGGADLRPDQGAEHRRPAGQGDPLHSRGDLHQPTVHLSRMHGISRLESEAMMDRTTIEAEFRTETGKSVARRLRQNGRIPGILYGGRPAVGLAFLEPQAGAGRAGIGDRTQHDPHGAGGGWRNLQRHARGLAVRTGAQQAAACGFETHRAGPATASHRTRSPPG